MLYKWSLGITILARLQGVLGLPWHGKTRETVKCIGYKFGKPPPSLLTKTENLQIDRTRHQNRKTAVFIRENR